MCVDSNLKILFTYDHPWYRPIRIKAAAKLNLLLTSSFDPARRRGSMSSAWSREEAVGLVAQQQRRLNAEPNWSSITIEIDFASFENTPRLVFFFLRLFLSFFLSWLVHVETVAPPPMSYFAVSSTTQPPPSQVQGESFAGLACEQLGILGHRKRPLELGRRVITLFPPPFHSALYVLDFFFSFSFSLSLFFSSLLFSFFAYSCSRV